MRDEEFTKFKQAWLGRCRGRQGKLPDEAALASMFHDLRQMTLQDVERGLTACAWNSPYMPTPNMVINGAYGSPEDRAA